MIYALNKNKYLLPPEREKLEFLLTSHLNSDRRNCVLLLTALYSGARATELLNLKSSDLNDYDQTIHIHGIKGSNDREIPLPHWLFQQLNKVSVSNGLVFDISYNRLRQIWQLYRPVHKKFHCLRHTFAITLYRKTKDIRLVQVALGHRNITNTMIYADYVYSQEELRKLIL
jgi:integrase/recombinase XerC